MKTLASRLKFAMDNAAPKKIKGVDLARAVGVKPPSVSDWLSGKSKTMEGENLLKAAKYLGVNALWLATGNGEIQSSQAEQIYQDHEKLNLARSPTFKRLINTLEELEANNLLNKDAIESLLKTAKAFSAEQKLKAISNNRGSIDYPNILESANNAESEKQ